MKPLISVVTPSWNQGKYISDCIESVMGLEDGLVEHIIVDNCSDDETAEVMAKYPHLRTLIEKDEGQSEALNKGIAMSKGDWVLWLNADDYMWPGALQSFVDLVRGQPDLDAVYGHMEFVREDGASIRTIFQPHWKYYMIWFGRFCLPSTGTLYRASMMRENPLDNDYHMIMDTEWTLRSGKHIKTRRLRRRAMAFRVTEDNKTSLNIRTGEVTPRHQAERDKLSKRFPYYMEIDAGPLGKVGVKLMRKFIRYRILADKLVSRLLDKGPSQNKS
jgi:glycosyltransferase involved in cell wall biosynthesis